LDTQGFRVSLSGDVLVKVNGQVAFAFGFWTSLVKGAWLKDALKNLVIRWSKLLEIDNGPMRE